ncbi:SHOCT domain-containing protein [Streptomyces sp. AP-93]|uniref:SHOCT domain-containing protein n=1 Tax=Streptomyces sp. AP-93 TaxID=2929048 RepID=UPI001FAF2BC1|nr:SHOCT domain-containing protein [Streptomyces sp. AP-93]MCJ0871497.1 SHOCT domain-containing protein [Streptomyces sp. AP-93]
MFIRPIGSVVNPSQRPSGHPLLRGILARGAYVWDASQHPAAGQQAQPQAQLRPEGGTGPEASAGLGPGPTPATAPGAGAAGAGAHADTGPAAPPSAAAPASAPSAPREPAAARPAPHAGPGAPGPVSPGADLTDRLTQLAALAREGLLTPEEFSAAKTRLLAG